jgi:hypothetical protein
VELPFFDMSVQPIVFAIARPDPSSWLAAQAQEMAAAMDEPAANLVPMPFSKPFQISSPHNREILTS